MAEDKISPTEEDISIEELKALILEDFRVANQSREASLLGRREVLTGKAKFGIFGDGKEVAQVAAAKYFEEGDFRSGYYRDQTFMMAAGLLTVQEFFAQLYAHTDVDAEPASAGRQMNGHFATRNLNENGSWKDLTKQKNSSADISPTAGQMGRMLGLAYASNCYSHNPELQNSEGFSVKGNEICFGSIGDASTSEGPFWESVNAAGVLQVPLVLSVWDDGHGISVPKKYQTTKESISQALAGMQRTETAPGWEIMRVNAWDYPALVQTYERAAQLAREEHVPVLVHVEECTQPQGHSTSGSHERYKSKDRLSWEDEFDCIAKMKEWILRENLATEEELNQIQEGAKKTVRQQKAAAWKAYTGPIKEELNQVVALLKQLAASSSNRVFIEKLANDLAESMDPGRKEIIVAARKGLRMVRTEQSPARQALTNWLTQAMAANADRYNAYLYSETADSALNVDYIKAEYSSESQDVDGREVLKANFDYLLGQHPEVIIFGEDSGKIGGVNQGLEGLQAKYGEHRVFDTGIREHTIIGQGIGMAMRGLRPIAEIQYLDYLLYALQIMSDDLSTLQYRTKGGQKAPLIIRTRGHRLEGIWHSGSPMGMVIHACRGMHICVPRNMVQAAGFYFAPIRRAGFGGRIAEWIPLERAAARQHRTIYSAFGRA